MNYLCPPLLETGNISHYRFDGEIGRRLRAVTEQWLLPAPRANPAMLEMFRERDRAPLREMVPWAGEFAGKYLTHATQILRITREERLETHLRAFVRELLSLQDADGYLGPWPKAYRLGLAGPPPNSGCVWDTWGHYHIMLGLLKWQALTDDSAALAGVCRIANMLCTAFLDNGRRIHEVHESEMNMAPYHALLLLYARTGETRYFTLAKEIEQDFAVPPAGDYVRTALRGLEFFQTPKPRWESLHAIQGLAERYFITGDEKYRRAFQHLWWSMLRGDRHNNGGFSSGEQATGNPYDWRAIETCCTVAWSALSVDMLRMTGSSIVADELELTLFNSGLGLLSPSGRWATYDTPMEGRRVASAHAIVFQSRPGSPELNCCSVNGPRVLGMLSDWALMHGPEGEALNYYGPGVLNFTLPSGQECRLEQVTDYPRDPRVEIRLNLPTAESFTLLLRIPHWSEQTVVSVNGKTVAGVAAGSYLPLQRCWQPGDVILILFDFRLHYWARNTGYIYQDWETNWQVFGPFPRMSGDQMAQIETLTSLPSGLNAGDTTVTASSLRSENGLLKGRSLPAALSGADALYCFTTVESLSAGMLPVRFSADCTTRIVVNGQTVFDQDSCGFDGDTTLRLYRTELPLRVGMNLICLLISRFPGRRPRQLLNIGRAEMIPSETSTSSTADLLFSSIYRGPLLLAFDHRYNVTDAENIPALDALNLPAKVVTGNLPFSPWLLLESRDAAGQPLYLCDFSSAGATGNPYRSWFNVRGVQPVEFSAQNPLRCMRP